MIFGTSAILACTIFVPGLKPPEPDMLPIIPLNVPLDSAAEAKLRGSVPWSDYRFEGEPEKQREFILVSQTLSDSEKQLLRLRTQNGGTRYSVFDPFEIRVGNAEDLGQEMFSFEQAAEGTCRINSDVGTKEDVEQ